MCSIIHWVEITQIRGNPMDGYYSPFTPDVWIIYQNFFPFLRHASKPTWNPCWHESLWLWGSLFLLTLVRFHLITLSRDIDVLSKGNLAQLQRNKMQSFQCCFYDKKIGFIFLSLPNFLLSLFYIYNIWLCYYLQNMSTKMHKWE